MKFGDNFSFLGYLYIEPFKLFFKRCIIQIVILLTGKNPYNVELFKDPAKMGKNTLLLAVMVAFAALAVTPSVQGRNSIKNQTIFCKSAEKK